MEKDMLNRKQLYDLVWSKPMRTISKIYCISDNVLRNICETMNIPLPKKGYWQKNRYGKRIKIEKLPNEFSGKKEVILIPRTKDCNDAAATISVQGALVTKIKSNPALRLIVPQRLANEDKLITNTNNIMRLSNDIAIKVMTVILSVKMF